MAGNSQLRAKDVVEVFARERGKAPEWLKILAREDQEFVVNWYRYRRNIVERGVIPRKFRELLLASLAAVTGRPDFVKIHFMNALKAGSSKRELLETVMLIGLSSGMLAFIPAFEAYAQVEGSSQRPKGRKG